MLLGKFIVITSIEKVFAGFGVMGFESRPTDSYTCRYNHMCAFTEMPASSDMKTQITVIMLYLR
jgi:hypothetical protein